MSALHTVKWHFMEFTPLVPSGLVAGTRTTQTSEPHSESLQFWEEKQSIHHHIRPFFKHQLSYKSKNDRRYPACALYRKCGRVSSWLLRFPPTPFTVPQTHCVSPLTELLNWLAVKNRSIPPLSPSQYFFLSFLPPSLPHVVFYLLRCAFVSVRGKATGRYYMQCNGTNQ